LMMSWEPQVGQVISGFIDTLDLIDRRLNPL
jgi:hypothetical protein